MLYRYRISLFSRWKQRGMYATCMWIVQLLLVLSRVDSVFVYIPEFYLEVLVNRDFIQHKKHVKSFYMRVVHNGYCLICCMSIYKLVSLLFFLLLQCVHIVTNIFASFAISVSNQCKLQWAWTECFMATLGCYRVAWWNCSLTFKDIESLSLSLFTCVPACVVVVVGY